MAEQKEIDPNALIMPTFNMGGFELPDKGSIKDGTGTLMIFTGEIKACGENESGLQFVAHQAGDESKIARIYCNTKANKGLSQIMGIGAATGVFGKIAEKRAAAGKKPICDANGASTAKVLQAPQFHEQLRKEIAGCKALCTIVHKPAKPYKDKETGEEKEGFEQAEIKEVAPAGNSNQPTPATATTSNAAADIAPDDEDAWEE